MPIIEAVPEEAVARAEFVARFVEWYVACALLVVGASLLSRPKVWINAISASASHPFAPLLWGLYALLAGLAVVMTHNIWVSDARVLVTAIGWLALAGGVLFLIVPESYAWVMRRIPITPQLVALRGLIRIAVGGAVLGYLLSQA